MKTNRLLPLEAMRGIAAIIVTFYHFAEGFADQAFPLLLGSPAFVLINGDAAVAFFFVLSGTVNCRPLFRDASPWNLFRSLLRRWPRLMMPALLASLFSWALYALDLYHFREAALITNSGWLARMANGAEPGFEPSLLDAIYQGTIGCFITGSSNYVPPLWTMHYELLGSLLVMVVAAGLARLKLWTGLGFGIAAALAAALLITPFYLPVFVCGALLTFVLMRQGAEGPISGWAMPTLLVPVLYLLNYAYPLGMHAWLPRLPGGLWLEMMRIGIQTLGALGLVVICLRWEALQRFASGRGAKLLGELSLPIFLLHVPIYCSASSWVLIHATPSLGQGIATGLAWLTAVALTLPASWAFAKVDAIGGRLTMTAIDKVLGVLRGKLGGGAKLAVEQPRG